MFASRVNEWWHWDFKGPFQQYPHKRMYYVIIVDKLSKRAFTKALLYKDNEPFTEWLKDIILEHRLPEKVTFDHGTDTGSQAVKGLTLSYLVLILQMS